MGNRGRPPKDMSQGAVERRRISGARITNARKNITPHMSRERLAELLRVHEKSLGRYENGENDLPEGCADALVSIFGGHADYWLGYAPTKDLDEWREYLKAKFALESAWSDVCAEISAKEACEKAESQLRRFFTGYQTAFHFLGFQYSYSTEDDTHSLTDNNGLHIGTFTWAEFEALLVELRHTVGFFGYKKNLPSTANQSK